MKHWSIPSSFQWFLVYKFCIGPSMNFPSPAKIRENTFFLFLRIFCQNVMLCFSTAILSLSFYKSFVKPLHRMTSSIVKMSFLFFIFFLRPFTEITWKHLSDFPWSSGLDSGLLRQRSWVRIPLWHDHQNILLPKTSIFSYFFQKLNATCKNVYLSNTFWLYQLGV